jgi:uroporphyrin-III C-methyltransferase
MDWAALARTGAPIVLYMAVSSLPGIVDALQQGGLPASTPALAVHAATTRRESLIEATLGALPALAAQGLIQSPSIVAVGAIAAFRQSIAAHLLDASPGYGAEAAE